MDQIEIIFPEFSYRRHLREQTLLVSLFSFTLMEEEIFEEINYETVPNFIILSLVLPYELFSNKSYLIFILIYYFNLLLLKPIVK